MTNEQYRSLQDWCKKSSNRKRGDYKVGVALRNEATQLRRQINGYRVAISDAIRILEQCKDDAAIKKWTDIVNANRDLKIEHQKKFDLL